MTSVVGFFPVPEPAKASVAKTIQSWSFSRLQDYETCALRAKLSIIDKIPHPEQPNSPAERGNKVHDALEKFVFKGGKQQPIEAKHFEKEIIQLKDLQHLKRAEGEQMWCFDRDWMPVDEKDYDRIWVRIKLDALAWLSSNVVVPIDYKTGKRDGNEIKHGQQLQIYTMATFLKFPQVEEAVAELWYLDKDILTKLRYRRDQALRHLKNWTDRGIRMTSDTVFKPNPSTWNCSYCPHRTGYMGKSGVMGNGACGLAP